MSFMTNEIIKRKKKYIYIYIYKSYLINCEYFNNLNENGDMARTDIMAGICTSPYSSPYPTEKVGNSPYPYPVNAEIPVKTRTGSGNNQRDGFICHL